MRRSNTLFNVSIAMTVVSGIILLSPFKARADHYFLFPQIGLGYGQAFISNDSQKLTKNIGQLDFNIGTEWDLGGRVAAAGWLLDLNYMVSNSSSRDGKWSRFDVAPMFSLSAGYNWWTAFARVAVGPHLSIARMNDFTAVGGGLGIDAAIGFKNAVEIFTDSFFSVDPKGPSFTVTGGVRLNAIAAVVLWDLLSGHPVHVHESRFPKIHNVRPARH